MLMLLFINKPLTFVLYLFGICLMILLSFQDGSRFWLTSLLLVPAFSIFYCTAITYYYFLRGSEKFEIRGVDIRTFKGSVRIHWLMSLIGLAIGIVLFINTSIVFFSSLFLVFYNAICTVALRCVIYAKFFSLAMKKNTTLENFKMEDLYGDIREILLKKIIN